MSKNNPVGDVPIATPLLKNMVSAVSAIYLNMSENEIRALDREIRSVTDKNCTADIKCIAEMYAQRVNSQLTLKVKKEGR